MGHVPVLLEETLTALDIHEGSFVIDGTLGGGGHANAILARIGAHGRLLGVDADPDALVRAKKTLGADSRVTFVRGSYAELPAILAREGLPKADALLLDLGFSSDQLEGGKRGFSFLRDEPLDMRYHAASGESAAALIARCGVPELARIFRVYGEERRAELFARAIVAARRRSPIRTSGALAAVIGRTAGRSGKIHPATKVFMALRIAVNRELEQVREMVAQVPDVVRAGGRAAIITFHSLEDRAVKEGFRELARDGAATIVTKHVVKPSRAEVLSNPRSRSAKLRIIRIL